MYEYEARLYGYYRTPLFVSLLRNIYKSKFVETLEDTSYIFGNTRYLVDSSGHTTVVNKEVIEEHKEKDLLKFSISKEVPQDLKDLPNFSKSDSTRRRKRDVYFLDESVQLHITQINFKELEVELDMESPDFDEKQVELFSTSFNRFMGSIEKHLKDFKHFLWIFNQGVRTLFGEMSRDIIAKPRDIGKKDFITTDRGIHEGYTLTVKGNGVPNLLYVQNGNVYLISPYKEIKYLNTSRFLSKESFIIIGEYFSDTNIFTPFDILYWSRQKDVDKHPNHLERMNIIETILKRNQEVFNTQLQVYMKPFVEVGETPQSFGKAYQKVKAEKYPFENDGMILTPIFAPQNPGVPKKDRQLSNHPEILKIKPWHELTIDFRVNLRTQELFTAYSTVPYVGPMVDWGSIPEEFDNQIVELRPENEGNDIILRFSRGRPDKPEPNKKGVVDDVWKLIMEPIPESTFLAKDFQRLRWQNNRIKRSLIQRIPKGSLVVDIGTGKGGDIFKYNNIAEVVLCIEPNDKNRAELRSRLAEATDLKTRFIVTDLKGEDTKDIMEAFIPIRKSYPNAKVVVSSMLSMTFFWKDRTTLDTFENTLKAIAKESVGADFYFFTVEGHRFRKYLSENNNKIINYGLKAQYDPEAKKYGVGIPGRLKVQLPDTIVELQREYLVDLNDLTCLRNLEYQEAIIEKYLTPEEFLYGRCAVFGTASIEY